MTTKELKKGESWRKGYQEGCDETAKAFGGCTNCYGKGYSTQIRDKKTMYDTCSCPRGKQVLTLIGDISDRADVELLEWAKHILPDFIEHHYPKGKTKDRGLATLACAQLILWLKKQL